MSDKQVTATIVEVLRNKLLDVKRGSNFHGGIFLQEVTHPRTNKRADALYVGLTNASGRHLEGFEIKASRSDWLREMRIKEKADSWADECQTWTIVAPPGVVNPDEVPEGFGFLELRETSTQSHRLRYIIKPRVYETRVPSWDAMRALLSRMESVRIKDVEKATFDATSKQVGIINQKSIAVQELTAQLREQKSGDDISHQIKEKLGMEVARFAHTTNPQTISVDDLSELLKTYLIAGKNVKRAARRLSENYERSSITAVRLNLEELEHALDKIQKMADSVE